MYKYEPIDNKVQDLYQHFNKDCISSIMEALLKTSSRNSLNDENLTVNPSVKLENLIRSVALFTEEELQTFVSILKNDYNIMTLKYLMFRLIFYTWFPMMGH